MKLLPIRNKKKEVRMYALVDDEDFKRLNQWKWSLQNKDEYFYCYRRDSKRKPPVIKLHREITNCPKSLIVDHINGNCLDNRRSNLRICSKQENNFNKKIAKNNTSGFKGVSFHRQSQRWQANIGFNGKDIFLGKVKSKKEAAKLYNKKAKELFGDFAHLNKL